MNKKIVILLSVLLGIFFLPVLVKEGVEAQIACRLMGDINGDEFVDITDLALCSVHYGTNWPQCDLDGDNSVVDDDDVAILSNYFALTVCRVMGDINGDRVVDITDMALCSVHYGTNWPQCDLDGDNSVVDDDDVAILSNYFALTVDRLMGDINGDCTVDVIDLALCNAHYGADWLQCDLDGNSTVDLDDAMIVGAKTGNSCPGVCVPNGCNGNCPASCTVAQDPDCGCSAGNSCCGIGCTYATDTDCPPPCVPDGCNKNCPASCTVAQDPDCGCSAGNSCCGIGCNKATDSDCPCVSDGCNGNCPAGCITAEDPDCGCWGGNSCCGIGCTNANDADCLVVCVSDGCNGNCPAGCTLVNDADCGCQNNNSCCGIGCTNANDTDCLIAIPPLVPNPLSSGSFQDLIEVVVNFLFWVGVTLAPLMILVGAFFVMTAAGDPSKVQRGKTIILYTAIGFIVVLLAKGLVSLVKKVVGG